MAPAFLEMRAHELLGIKLFDALTNETQEIFISVGLVSADTPAAAKLGDHVGHGGYQPCIACNYIGTICGCKAKDGDEPPPVWENFLYRSGSRKLASGSQSRKKKKGEHICFLDTELITRENLRRDEDHRAGQILVGKTQFKPLSTKAAEDRLRRLTKSNGVSPLILLASGLNFYYALDF